jgi:hypothetical protein
VATDGVRRRSNPSTEIALMRSSRSPSQLRLIALKAMVERELREFVMSAGMRALDAVHCFY